MTPLDEHDPAWLAVKARRDIGDAAKLAWRLLWTMCGRQTNVIDVSYHALALDQEKSETSARRWVRQLADAKLVARLPCTLSSTARLYLPDPQDSVASTPPAQPVPAHSPATATTPANVPPGIPHRVRACAPAPSPSRSKDLNHQPSVPSDPSPSKPSPSAPAPSASAAADPSPEPDASPFDQEAAALAQLVERRRQEHGLTAGSGCESIHDLTRQVAVAMLERRPGDAIAGGKIDALVERIRQFVGDPNLEYGPTHKVASAVVDGVLPEQELRAILRCLAARRDKGSLEKPGAYFVVSAKNAFLRRRIPWTRTRERRA